MAITSDLDALRLEIADTDVNAQLLQDDELNWILTQESNHWGAAARACEIIARGFLRKADVRIGRGGTTLTYSTAAKQYFDMATAFRKRANAMNAPWSGGRSISEKESLAADPDAVQPIFSKTMFNDNLAGPAPSFIEDQD
jgi:hypothetical protein